MYASEQALARNLDDLTIPGTTPLVIDAAATAETRSGRDFTVMASEAVPEAGP